MRKLNLTLPLLLLLFTAGFAQGDKPAAGKVVPNLIKLNTNTGIDQHQELFRTHLQMSTDDEFRLIKTTNDDIGFTHQKFQQYFRGVKVDGCTYSTHSTNGLVRHMSGNFRAIGENINMSLVMPARNAFEKALDYVNASEYAWQANSSLGVIDGYEKPRGDLVIVPDLKQIAPARLAYVFDIYAAAPLYRAEVYIDAQTGAFIKENDKLCAADVNASGNSLYNGNVSFKADSYNGSYRLRQATNGIQTFDMNGSTNYNNAQEVTSSSTSFNNATAVQAHWGAENTHSYFLQNHSRDSYNGSGATIKSYVSYDNNYVNAFWDGSRMTYGDGNGSSYGPLVALDIVGHEITHGVVQFSANLVYSYESGALNESFADIFGESIENYATGSNDWYMGTDIGIGGSGALRSMSNPNAFGDPDTYKGTNWHTASTDNGGVHINSGVQNKWFYILTTGESGTNDVGSSYSVTGLGITKAAAIAYRNLSTYLSTNSQYLDARAGAIQAATDLYGADSDEVIATTDAWYAVGVGSAYSGGGGGGTTPTCADDGAVTLSITFDNYPEETSWAVTSGGSTVASGSYSTSNADGSTVTESLNLGDGDYTFTINDAYGDGICCSYGNGAYSLTSGGSSLASGGSFTSSESTTFCIESAGSGADTQAPSTPTNLTASGTTETQTTLSWNASTDNVGVTGYNVYSGGSLLGNTANTSVGITGLTASTTYTYSVTAVDAAGNESGSSSVTVTTLDDGPVADTQAPTTPSNLSASNTTQTTTDLSWNASSDNVGVTGYNVYSGGSLLGNTANTSAGITGLTASTTYTYSVTAVDAAGNESGSSSVTVTTLSDGGGGGGPETILGSYFETGMDGWTDGGSDCYRYNGTRSYEGTRSIRLRDNSGTVSAMTSSAFDASGYGQIEVTFYFYANSMENNEDFWVRFYDGNTWHTVASYARGTNFDNNTFYSATVNISSADYNFASNSQLRFQCDASGNADQVYIDQVTAIGSSTLIAGTTTQSITQLDTPNIDDGATFTSNDDLGEILTVYPNPTSDFISITGLTSDVETILVYNISGALVQEVRAAAANDRISVTNLHSGIYFLSILTQDGEVTTTKFVKK